MATSPTWLIHFSGGLDSTYALWQWLVENPNEHILVHHVRLQHVAERREEYEEQAVLNTLHYLRCVGFKNFSYHESAFDYGSLPRIAVKDIQIVSLFTGIILRTEAFSTIKNLILSWHKGEVNQEEIMRGYRVRNMLKALECGEDLKFHFPIEHLTRAQMIEQLPKELVEHIHSCRKPTKDKQRCGQCKTCEEYINEGLDPL